MSSTYWKANKATSAKIKQIYKDRSSWTKIRCDLARRLGFSTLVATMDSSWMGERVVGFYVKRNATDPDKKLYKKSRQRDERGIHCWIPKRVKVNVEINSLLDQWFTKNDMLGEALSIEMIINMTAYNIGVHIRKSVVYIEADEDQGSLAGCRQISDITFRKARDAKK